MHSQARCAAHDDPYYITLDFDSDSLPGHTRLKTIDSNDDPCVATHDQGSTASISVDLDHNGLVYNVAGHPSKHSRNAHVITGKVITIDEVPDSEHGTATTTISWSLRYCQMMSTLAPLSPMKC